MGQAPLHGLQDTLAIIGPLCHRNSGAVHRQGRGGTRQAGTVKTLGEAGSSPGVAGAFEAGAGAFAPEVGWPWISASTAKIAPMHCKA